MYYERPVKNTPDEHGQRPQPGDIVAVFACHCVETVDGDIYRLHETPIDDIDDGLKDMWIGVYIRYRDGQSLALIDLTVPRDEDGEPFYDQPIPRDINAVALVDLLTDLPLGRLDQFACQVHDLPVTG